MILTKGLTKKCGGKAIVDGVDIRVREGEVYGLLGPNGAGKTTTILMILGLVSPTSGELRLLGETHPEDHVDVRQRVGVVGESQRLYWEMTGYEYLSFFAGLYGLRGPRRVDSRICGLLERLELSRFRDLPLRAYSKGMQQKMALARALLHDPALLILDEPTSGLDPHGIRRVRQIIQEENAKGKTFLISSHLLSEVEKTCHRIGILNRGSLVAEDTTGGVRERLSGGYDLQIELEQVWPGIDRAIRTLPAVESVSLHGNVAIVHVRQGGPDHRAEISRMLTNHGCVVIGMKRNEMSLEDAFITITEQNIKLLTGKAVVETEPNTNP